MAGQTTPATATACDRAETHAGAELSTLAAKRGDRLARLSNKIVAAMGEFRRQYPVETSELDDSVESACGYRELHGLGVLATTCPGSGASSRRT